MLDSSRIVGLNERPSELRAAIKSPVVFNAFAILAVVVLVVWGRPSMELWYALGFVRAVTVSLNSFAACNPRFLMHGPAEYLRELVDERERWRPGIEEIIGGPSRRSVN